jgi:tol-pal system protein YbgF
MARETGSSLLMALCAPLVLTGCLATTQEIEDLRVDITRFNAALDKAATRQAEFQTSLQGNQADLLSQMSTLSGKLEALAARLEENDSRMASLAARLDDLDKNMSSRLEILSEGVTTSKKAAAAAPSKLFQLAYNDYMKRRYGQALRGFEDYLEVYPDTEKAAEAQFYAGESRFAQKQWKEALEAYDRVIVKYASAEIVPAAILQKGATLEKMGQTSAAMNVYETLVKRFPQKPEAESGKARLAFLLSPAPEQVKDAPAPKPASKPAAVPAAPAAPKKPAPAKSSPRPKKTLD